MTNKLSNLENSLKDSLENHELPYNEDHWGEMEKNLDKVSEGAVAGYGIGWSLMGGIAIIGVIAGAYFYTQNSSQENSTSKLPKNTINTSENMSVKNKVDSTDKFLSENPLKTDFLKTTESINKTNSSPKNKKREIFNPTKIQNNKNDGHNASKSKMAADENSTSKDLTKFSVNTRKGCEGLLIQFNLDHPDPKANYLWNFGDGYFSNEANPSHAFNKTGMFDVSISVTSSAYGNISSNTIANMVEIESTPEANFESSKDISGNIKFSNKSKEAQKYNWDFGDGTTSSELNPNHFYKNKGEFIVKLVATNNTGCSDELTKNIMIERDYNLLATEMFVPTKNEMFMPSALFETSKYQNFELQIFDATNGIVIFNSKKSTQQWNGKLPTGEFANPGKYPWFVTQKLNDGRTEIYKGIVEIK